MAYVAVVLTGASTSSLGIWALRERPGAPLGTMWGDPVGLRSDEFLTQTSLELNVLSLGHSSHSPLAHGPDLVFQLSSGQPFETLFFLESNLLRLGPWLPDTMLFAAVRALPLLVLALTLPRLLRRLGATRPLSWLAFTLVVAAPTSLWWSFTPVRILAFASLGGFLLVLAKEHWVRATRRSSYAVALALAAAGGIATARLGTYYIPWCLTIGVPLVVAVAAWLVTGPPRRAGWIVLGTGALSGAVLLGLTMWENSTALRATLATVYPGLRRSNGEAVQPFELFGAPGLTYLQDGRPVAVLNQSEISSAFLVCLVWALLLVGLRRRTSVEATAALWGLAGTIAVWLAWIVAPWGAWAQQLPLLSLVPPARAAQTLGFAAALLVCLLLSQTRPSGTARALTAGACATVVTVYGVASLRLALPELTPALVWLPALVVGAVVALVTRWPSRALVIGPVCALLVLAGIG